MNWPGLGRSRKENRRGGVYRKDSVRVLVFLHCAPKRCLKVRFVRCLYEEARSAHFAWWQLLHLLSVSRTHILLGNELCKSLQKLWL